MRDLYLQAEQDILLHGQSSVMQGRALTTADLPEVRKGRQEWEARAAREAQSSATRRAGPAAVATFRD